MLTIRRTFHEVAIRATKRFTDAATGKRRTRTRKFFQTLNPYNKLPDGRVKGADDIRTEIKAERDAWMATPEPEEAPKC